MTRPSVTEIPTGLEAVEPDPFIDALPASPDLGAMRLDRELRERPIERVRRLIRGRVDRDIRNGRTATGTDRV